MCCLLEGNNYPKTCEIFCGVVKFRTRKKKKFGVDFYGTAETLPFISFVYDFSLAIYSDLFLPVGHSRDNGVYP